VLRALILGLFLLSCSSLPLLSNDDQNDARRIVEKLGVAKGAALAQLRQFEV
jgi:hypothetical protein